MEKISFSAALKDFDLIILNQSLNNDFDRFWAASKLRLVADGAANQLHSHNHLLTPDFVIGDFDSISDKILDYYKSKCKVLQITDQDSTDFQKCIKKILEIEQTRAVTVDRSPSLFALGALSGRLDHTISCLNTLLKFPHKRIFLISADSVATLVNPGDTEIFCHKDYEGDTCGLLPLTGTALVKTTGLKWNLDHSMPMNFGSLISTSNLLGEEGFDLETGLFKITVSTDIPLIFTVERKLLQS